MAIDNFQGNPYDRQLEDRDNMGMILADQSITSEDRRLVEKKLRNWNYIEVLN